MAFIWFDFYRFSMFSMYNLHLPLFYIFRFVFFLSTEQSKYVCGAKQFATGFQCYFVFGIVSTAVFLFRSQYTHININGVRDKKSHGAKRKESKKRRSHNKKMWTLKIYICKYFALLCAFFPRQYRRHYVITFSCCFVRRQIERKNRNLEWIFLIYMDVLRFRSHSIANSAKNLSAYQSCVCIAMTIGGRGASCFSILFRLFACLLSKMLETIKCRNGCKCVYQLYQLSLPFIPLALNRASFLFNSLDIVLQYKNIWSACVHISERSRRGYGQIHFLLFHNNLHLSSLCYRVLIYFRGCFRSISTRSAFFTSLIRNYTKFVKCSL